MQLIVQTSLTQSLHKCFKANCPSKKSIDDIINILFKKLQLELYIDFTKICTMVD